MDSFIDSLLRWLQTFDIDELKSVNLDLVNLSDGIIIGKVLNKIVPDYFDDEWIQKLNVKLNDNQWQIKVSNIKKVIEKIIDYYENNLFLNLDTKLINIDASKIAKTNDKNELTKLLQLILGIAVNCDNKQQYIQEITSLDLNVQQNLMEIIQLLHNESTTTINQRTESIFDSNNVKYLKEQFVKLLDTIKELNQKEDDLNEKNYELKNKLKLKEEEQNNLLKELEKLNLKLKSIEQSDNLIKNDEINEHNYQLIKLKSKVDCLEKDLLKSENQREELQINMKLMQNELTQINKLNDELQKKVKETKQLKDELDVHRETADKIIKYEEQIEFYKNKLEELSDLKKQFRLIEDKNKLLVENNIQLEEEIKKMNLLKSQINDYKKQLSELHQQLIECTHKSDKNEFDLKKLNEKYELLNDEKQLLEKEKFELKSQLDKLKINQLDSNQFSLIVDDHIQQQQQLNKHNLNFEIKSEEIDLKEKLIRLELENKHLKIKLDEANQEDLLLTKANYEDSKIRIKDLENDNRNLNKKLIETESKLNDLELTINQQENKDDNKLLLNKIDQEHLIQQLKIEIKSLKQKLTEKDHQLNKKDEKIMEVEEKHRKYLEKAKEVYTLIEPVSLNSSIINFGQQTNNNSLQSNLTQYSDTIINPAKITDPNLYSNLTNDQLKQILFKTNQMMVNINDEFVRYKNGIDFEQRLMTSSIHGLAFNLMRNSATERVSRNGNSGLNNNNSSQNNSFYGSTNSNLNLSNLSLNTGNGQNSISFLAKQRQTTSRKINLEKVSNSIWNTKPDNLQDGPQSSESFLDKAKRNGFFF